MGWGREGEGSGLGGQGGCNRRIEKFLGKFTKKKFQGGGVRVWLGGQSGCERRIEVFVKIKKKKKLAGSGWGGGGGSGWM